MMAGFNDDDEKVRLTFRINYGTEPGQALSIVGDNEATGNWSDLSRGMMKWTQDNWWVVTIEVDPSRSFMYKYVVIDYDSKSPLRWEEGRNRICDPEYIPRVSEFSNQLEPLV